ncbi:helix-turn-helix transcriptional regulator [Paenibacillus sp. FSL R5-0486]|uniref:helix-turn-helix domain-containing protein n=1 Tax=Paenibacillus sp. FSL R5-0486 TaxID=2921645 RepID=UPI0030D8773E
MRKPDNNLMYLRMMKFMSQKEVAEQLEISQAYYSKLEKNPSKISLGMAGRLKVILQADTIDDFLKHVV